MKKLILAGLLSIGVACADDMKCESKACKDFMEQVEETYRAFVVGKEIEKLCSYYDKLSIKEAKLIHTRITKELSIEERKLLKISDCRDIVMAMIIRLSENF